MRLGIEAGIEHRAVPTRRMDADEWERNMPYQGGAEGPSRSIESVRVRFHNSKGQEICGSSMRRRSRLKRRWSSFPGIREKEGSLLPLVATLLASFWAFGKNLVVLRYDGINRPGESHQDETNAKRGYEMLGYRWGQGLDDSGGAFFRSPQSALHGQEGDPRYLQHVRP